LVVEIRYFAAAADLTDRGTDTLNLPDGATIADLSAALISRYGDGMTRMLRVAAFLTDGELTRDPDRVIGEQVDLLPPFAGG
jgi:molybdopterin converting factor small subunit